MFLSVIVVDVCTFRRFALSDKIRAWFVSWCQQLPFSILPRDVLEKPSTSNGWMHRQVKCVLLSRDEAQNQTVFLEIIYGSCDALLRFHGVSFRDIIGWDESFFVGYQRLCFPPITMSTNEKRRHLFIVGIDRSFPKDCLFNLLKSSLK